MIPDFIHGETIQHLRFLGNTKNPDGYRANTYAEATPIENVGIDVPKNTEPRDGTTELAQTDIILFLPTGYEVDARDRFNIRGKIYEAEGPGIPIKNFFTGDTYRTELAVRRIYGQEKPQI